MCYLLVTLEERNRWSVILIVSSPHFDVSNRGPDRRASSPGIAIHPCKLLGFYNRGGALHNGKLTCLDLSRPCALVVSSNQLNAFAEANPEVMSFVKCVGELVHFDLIEGAFVSRVREFKPSLFSMSSSQ